MTHDFCENKCVYVVQHACMAACFRCSTLTDGMQLYLEQEIQF